MTMKDGKGIVGMLTVEHRDDGIHVVDYNSLDPIDQRLFEATCTDEAHWFRRRRGGISDAFFDQARKMGERRMEWWALAGRDLPLPARLRLSWAVLESQVAMCLMGEDAVGEPYATAPLDGTPVVVWCEGYRDWVGPIFWHEYHESWANVSDHHLRGIHPLFWRPA